MEQMQHPAANLQMYIRQGVETKKTPFSRHPPLRCDAEVNNFHLRTVGLDARFTPIFKCCSYRPWLIWMVSGKAKSSQILHPLTKNTIFIASTLSKSNRRSVLTWKLTNFAAVSAQHPGLTMKFDIILLKPSRTNNTLVTQRKISPRIHWKLAAEWSTSSTNMQSSHHGCRRPFGQ